MVQDNEEQSAKGRFRLSGPVGVGLFFGLLAIVLSLLGLGREHNLSLRNIALAIVLCGGVWGLISWAIATAVVDVEKDVADSTEEDSPQRHEGHKEEQG